MNFYVEANSFDEAIQILKEQERNQLMSKASVLQLENYGYERLKALPIETLRAIVEENRGTGKTTAHALRLIAEAMSHPNEPVAIIHDHFDNYINNRYMARLINNLIDKLGFKFLEINYASLKLVYKI